MSDPIERVARAYYEASDLPIFEMEWNDLGAGDRAIVCQKVKVFFQVLTEQGIPVDKLLSGEMVAVPMSGEMVAVPKEPTPKMLEHAYHGPVISWHRMIEAHQQAQLDYAGGQIVTPEDCQHEWTDARNEVITQGEICLKCNSVRG